MGLIAGRHHARRNIVRSVIDELNHAPVTRQLGLAMEVKLWEDVVLSHFESPPQTINRAAEESIADNDIFIGILKDRLGTHLPAEFGGRTGTEYEFDEAFESYRLRGTPRILLYFGSTPTPISDQSSLAQLRAVAAYKAKLSEHSLVSTFASEHEFGEEVRRDLTRFLADWPASVQPRRTLGSRMANKISVKKFRPMIEAVSMKMIAPASY